MNKFFNAFIVMTTSSMFTYQLLAQDVEEIVVTSALIDTTRNYKPSICY